MCITDGTKQDCVDSATIFIQTEVTNTTDYNTLRQALDKHWYVCSQHKQCVKIVLTFNLNEAYFHIFSLLKHVHSNSKTFRKILRTYVYIIHLLTCNAIAPLPAVRDSLNY